MQETAITTLISSGSVVSVRIVWITRIEEAKVTKVPTSERVVLAATYLKSNAFFSYSIVIVRRQARPSNGVNI